MRMLESSSAISLNTSSRSLPCAFQNSFLSLLNFDGEAQSSSAEIIEASVADADASGLPYYIVGHVGDGNFHLAYLVKEGDAGQRATAERLSMQMVQRAIALEGTCTGEHGIGLHKMGFLEGETGAGAIAAMRAIKRALDPGNIMNPGKIFAL